MRTLLGPAAALLCIAVLWTAQAQEPATCENAVTEANTHFLFGRFDEASGLLEACLVREVFSEEEKPPVYELLAQVYEADGQEQEARAAVAALLALDPGYEPAPDVAASFSGFLTTVTED